MSKKVNWWWIVATHKRGTVSMEECKELGMHDFLDWHIAAKVFTSLSDARSRIRMLKRNNAIPEGIQLRVLSDEAWMFVKYMYFKGKWYGQMLLS